MDKVKIIHKVLGYMVTILKNSILMINKYV